MLRRLLLLTISLFCLIVACYTFRTPILRWFATSLIVEDPVQNADAMFVLSGGGYDRGNEAAKIVKGGYVNRIIWYRRKPFYRIESF